MITNLFKPKWQHENPELRKKAVEALSAQEERDILLEIANHDSDSGIRCLAARKLNDLPALRQVLEYSDNREVRQLAIDRLQEVLAGVLETSSSLSERQAFIAQVTSQEILAFIALQGVEPEIRLSALEKVTGQDTLAHAAVNDAVVRNRLAALEKLHDCAQLEQVIRLSRNKDKRIHREAQDKLAVLQQQQERPRQIRAQREALCARLARLTETEDWEKARKEYVVIEQQWQELAAPGGDADLFQQFVKTYQRFRQNLQEYQDQQARYSQIRMDKQTVLDALAVRAREIVALARLPAEEAQDLAQFLADRHMAWQYTGELTAAEERDTQRRYAELVKEINESAQKLQQIHATAQAYESLCGDLRAVLEAPTPGAEKKFHTLQQRWQAVAKPNAASELLRGLEARWRELVKQWQDQCEHDKAKQKSEFESFKDVLAQLEQALEQGELHEAVRLEKQLRQGHTRLASVPQIHALEPRLHAVNAKFRELCGWLQWGNDLEREKLCVHVESLPAQALSPEAVVKAIQEAQQQWRQLSHLAGDRSNQTLWKRFQTACQAAYEPCKQHFSQQAEQRREFLAAKQAVCVEIETLLRETDWEHADWKAIQRYMQDKLKAWHAIGPVDRKEKRAINKHFDTIMAELGQKLDAERSANQLMRKQLIEKAQALHAITDARKAVAEAKQLQAEWKITVSGTRKEERELWDTFRAACDHVFARRRDEQDAVSQQWQAILEAKSALCAELEAQADSSDAAALKNASARVAKARQQWAELGPTPKKALPQLDNRFDLACQALKSARHRLIQREAQQYFAQVAAKAAVCLALEQAITAGQGEAALAGAQAEWQALPALANDKDEAALQARFAAACAAIGGWPADALAQARKNREFLCLRLELAAGIDSPPEARQARMEYHVQRLSQAMGGDKSAVAGDATQEAEQLELQWYSAGPSAADLESRFRAAITAMKGHAAG